MGVPVRRIAIVVVGPAVPPLVSVGETAVAKETGFPVKSGGFAITATIITIATPARSARISPDSTYNTGQEALKNLPPYFQLDKPDLPIRKL
jgi:hypothetical protein